MKECCRFKTGNCASLINPQSEENFALDRRRPDGLTPHCKSCLKKYRDENKQQRNEVIKEWRKNNSEKLREYSLKKNALEHTKKRMQRYRLKKRYGITTDYWNQMLIKQDNKCGICRIDMKTFVNNIPRETVLHVDHDHVTGKIRGLLCSTCNKLLGLAKENPVFLRVAASYLENGGCH